MRVSSVAKKQPWRKLGAIHYNTFFSLRRFFLSMLPVSYALIPTHFSSRMRLPKLTRQGVMYGDANQRVNDNCGVATLKMFLDAYGIDIPKQELMFRLDGFFSQPDIRQLLANIPQRGGLTNVDMMLFLEALDAKPRMADLSRTDNIDRLMAALNQHKPAIILDSDIAEGHFYLLIMDSGRLLKYDPSHYQVQSLNRLQISKPGSYAIYTEGVPQRYRLNNL